MSLMLLLFACSAFFAGTFVLRAGNLAWLRQELVTYRLTFAPDLKAEEALAFVSSLSGLLMPWWRRWLYTPFVVFEVRADSAGITHDLLVPRGWAAQIENALQAHVAVRYSRIDRTRLDVRTAAEYRLSSSDRPLRIDPGMPARLLASLQPLNEREQLIVQWVVTAAPLTAPARAATKGEGSWTLLRSQRVLATAEDVSALRHKQAEPLMLAVGRVGVAARSLQRSRALLRQVEAVWHVTRVPGVELRRRSINEVHAATRLRERKVPLVTWAGTYNAAELAHFIGWPIGVQQLQGLTLGGCRPLAPSSVLGDEGTVIGTSTFPGSERAVAIDVQARLRHLHVVGPTGTGKSTLLLHIVEQDLRAGNGVVVIDPKGDLVSAVLERVPASRRGDVIVLDPADRERAVGLNPLRGADEARLEVAVENIVGLLKSLYRASWGPRTDDILRAALLTLAGTEDATLCEVPVLLTDPVYRRRVIGALDDPIGLESFWGWYEGLSDPERLSVVGPVLNKVRAFTMRPRVRAIIGQARPALSLDEVLAERKVLLVSLASGLLGEEAAALLGALVFAELWHATTARAGISEGQRQPVMAVLDEWQHFLHLPTPMASVLAEARGLGLGLTLAHQHIGQLPDAIRDGVLANARSRVVFQVPGQDARLLAREMGNTPSAPELQTLDAFEVVAQLFAAGRVQPPVTLATAARSPAVGDGHVLRRASRDRFGVPFAEVEAAIRSRHEAPRSDAPIGRRRRPGGSS